MVNVLGFGLREINSNPCSIPGYYLSFYKVFVKIAFLFFTFLFQTAQQLQAEYDERRKRLNYTYHMYASFTYDAAWSIAVMLNKSIPLLRKKNKTLETIEYGDKEVAEIMTDMLSRTDLWGMSVCKAVLVYGRFFFFFLIFF